MHAIPLLLSIIVGLLLGLVVWGFLRTQSQRLGDVQLGTRGDIFTALLILAAFALGVFLTYVLMGINF